MKTKTSFSLLLLFVLGSVYAKPIPASSFNQSKFQVQSLAEVFGSFHAHRQGVAAALNWNVTTDNVSSFIIERSYDGSTFEVVTEIAPGTDRWNRYIDRTVEPGLIYYRIIAIMNDGTSESSPVELVKIVKH